MRQMGGLNYNNATRATRQPITGAGEVSDSLAGHHAGKDPRKCPTCKSFIRTKRLIPNFDCRDSWHI